MIDPKYHRVIAEQLLQIFGGNDYHAVGKLRTAGSGMWYDYIQDAPLTVELLEKHLKGSINLGSYPILKGNMVNWIGWDVDAKNDMPKAKEYAQKIIQRIEHLPYVVEFSGGKGYHIFLFLSAPMDAKEAKQIAAYIRDSEDLPKSGPAHVEIYPKQDSISGLSEDGTVKQPGNLLKIPLGQHPVSNQWSKFIDPLNGWEEAPPLEPQELLKYNITLKAARELAEAEGDPLEEVTKIMATEWRDGVRHELALALSGFLCSIGWAKNDVIHLIEQICDEVGDSEKENRIQTVNTTFKRQVEGKTVAGASKLIEILRPQNFKVLSEYAFKAVLPSTAIRVEHIRVSKGQLFQKRNKVVNLVWTYLSDTDIGNMLLAENENENEVTAGGQLFWFDRNRKLVIPFGSIQWQLMLEQKFNIIRRESFSIAVSDQLELRCLREATPVKVYRKAAFLNGILYVNLGGTKTYVLDGMDIKIEFNGDHGIFFQSHADQDWIEPNFDNPKDIWKYLVDDINFSADRTVSVDPEAQKELLKAWIISTFFGTILPVRPILTMLGERGSGKTTALQRMIRLLEGEHANVTSLAVDKPDSWRTLVQNQHIIVLDNLERIKTINWLVKELNTIATGGTITIRKLYTSNEAIYINLDSFVGVTAIEMPFSDEALYDRLLPLNLDRLDMFIPLNKFNVTFEENKAFYWADLFLKLNQAVRAVNANAEIFNEPGDVRLSDFVAFCKAIADCDYIDREAIIRGVTSIHQDQSSALASSINSVVPILYQWLNDRPADALREYSPGELFSTLKEYTRSKKVHFPWTRPNSFALHVKSVLPQLEREFGFNLERFRDKTGRKTTYNFEGIRQNLEVRAKKKGALQGAVKEGDKYIIDTTRIAEEAVIG